MKRLPVEFMPSRLKNGAVFLHVQKTGGSWVEHVFKELDLEQRRFGDPHSEYDRCLQQELTLDGWIPYRIARKMYRGAKRLGLRGKEEPFRFCFVRHPLSWYESYFRYFAGLGWPLEGIPNRAAYWHPNAFIHDCKADDFNEFMERVLHRRPGFASELFARYTNLGISFIGKTEHLVDHLVAALRLAGETFDEGLLRSTPRVNESSLPKSAAQWDPDLKLKVLRMELPALVQYDYLTEELADELGMEFRVQPHEVLYRS